MSRTAIAVLTMAAAVFTLSLAAVELRPAGSSTAAWWPAAGLAVAWLLRTRRQDRTALLAAVAVASGAANLVGGRPVALSAAFGVANAFSSAASN